MTSKCSQLSIFFLLFFIKNTPTCAGDSITNSLDSVNNSNVPLNFNSKLKHTTSENGTGFILLVPDEIHEKTYNSFGWLVISNLCGIIYVAAWMASYYPQAYMNWKRKRVDGLSHDLAFYNVIGYICYSIFTCVQFAYQRYHNSANAVEPVDIAFSLHSLLITTFIGIQILFYPRGKQTIGKTFQFFMIAFALCTISLIISSSLGLTPWLTIPPKINSDTGFINQIYKTFSFVQYLGYVKSLITFMKYIPQVQLNYLKKSTEGMSCLNYVLDFFGGFLSLAQNVIDAINYRDSAYIIGNIPKLIISISTIFYDIIILMQHFVLYPSKPSKKRIELELKNIYTTQI